MSVDLANPAPPITIPDQELFSFNAATAVLRINATLLRWVIQTESERLGLRELRSGNQRVFRRADMLTLARHITDADPEGRFRVVSRNKPHAAPQPD